MNRKAFLLSLAGLPAAAAEYRRMVTLPAPGATPSATNGPRVIPRPAGAQLTVPKGFTVEELAAGFNRPRMMISDSPGTFLLAENSRQGPITRVSIDGKRRTTVLSGLDRPFGLKLSKGYLYVAETTSLKRYRYNAPTGRAEPGQEIFSMKDYGGGHATRAIEIDENAGKLFVSIGSNSNVDAGEPRDRAAILRMNLDGSNKEYYAEGTRNPVSIHLQPGTNKLWVVVQERDALGDDLVPDYFTSITPGGFYGWPYAYIGPNEDPRRKGEKPGLVAKTVAPDYPLRAHAGIIDFTFYTGKQFPRQYQGGAFITFHGSWTRSKRVGQSVVFVPFDKGKPSADYQDFLTGWMLSPDNRDVWGRPTGLLQLPDGSLLVSDDGGNRIWKVTYTA
jgi:glucose/arabinose dehydrogenase